MWGIWFQMCLLCLFSQAILRGRLPLQVHVWIWASKSVSLCKKESTDVSFSMVKSGYIVIRVDTHLMFENQGLSSFTCGRLPRTLPFEEESLLYLVQGHSERYQRHIHQCMQTLQFGEPVNLRIISGCVSRTAVRMSNTTSLSLCSLVCELLNYCSIDAEGS